MHNRQSLVYSPMPLKEPVQKVLLRWFLTLATVAMLGAIWYLTAQSAVGTSELSSGAGELLARVLRKLERVTDQPIHKLVVADAVNVTVVPLGLDLPVRKLAHTAQFGALCFLLLPTVWCWMQRLDRWRSRTPFAQATIITLLLSVCSSLVDQTHKLYVPARHWDTGDLAYDFAGYFSVIVFFWVLVLIRRLFA